MCRDCDISHTVTDIEEFDGDEHEADPRQRTLQGPLRPGDYTSIGTFGDLIDKVHRNKGETADHPKAAGEMMSVEVMVVADYSSEDLLIGAKRTFNAELKGEQWLVKAKTAETQQIRWAPGSGAVSRMFLSTRLIISAGFPPAGLQITTEFRKLFRQVSAQLAEDAVLLDSVAAQGFSSGRNLLRGCGAKPGRGKFNKAGSLRAIPFRLPLVVFQEPADRTKR